MKEKKNPLIFWGIIVLIIGMIAAVFIPMMTMRGTMADTVSQLNEKYDEDFTLTWSNIDDTPMSDTFEGIVKSNNTAITYDVIITDGDAVIAYEEENFNAQINDVTEATLTNAFAMANAKDGKLTLRVLSSDTVDATEAEALATQLKADFVLSSVSIETLQITEDQLTEAKAELSEYYQRSTVASEETFEGYEPVVNKYEF